MFRRICRRATAALLASALFIAAPAQADDLVVFAAASLTNALEAVAARWMDETGSRVVISFAGSSALARQIEAGAPADIFISANTDWMDALAAAGELREGSRRAILGNSLVLIAHGGDASPVTIDENPDLVSMLDGGRLSMALVDSVPAGMYGREALTTLGLWGDVAPHVAQSDNVRSALAFVALGEAPLGIVYASDARVEDSVSVIATFPEGSHTPITLPAAITAQSEHPRAQDFLDFLSSDIAAPIWREYGFSVAG
ncbi:MAG: ABC-type molybdenum uptake system substrate-binding component ModA [Saliniramus fredricksonii]|uniref:ABC-type molybdenum uptake system substrate-binding component ModA n=1 Tax=Saliniramus fredricksonii TaxID=1653334 RepID=A0A0P7XW49_9HYPH|nr:molybdate ABC transporter substrate-binding protein [Saliniramus fredricksonii]KPQ08733.1 MAG: ABC-type molybdenum uptake system substrate-binding component ModA [Saliniramus fredricksonii]SCC81678.1 molybdate transport system substrate-binding protein [Saliniramus fredricksonii]